MKSRLDELYEAREAISKEIERVKRRQNSCNHIFTPLIFDPVIDKDKNINNRWYRRCVSCDKIEYSNSLEEPEFVPELSFNKK